MSVGYALALLLVGVVLGSVWTAHAFLETYGTQRDVIVQQRAVMREQHAIIRRQRVELRQYGCAFGWSVQTTEGERC